MSKIVAVSDQVVKIGLDDGSLREVRLVDCAFTPQVGDAVEVYGDENSVHVVKAAPAAPVSPAAQTADSGAINVTISNDNSGGMGSPLYVTQGKVVSKVVYGLLAIFLGSFGVHKFYAGKSGMGILYLIFSWTFLPGLAGFIEGIVALTKPADANGNIII